MKESLSPNRAAASLEVFRVAEPVYGGDNRAQDDAGGSVLVPFTLTGERVEVGAASTSSERAVLVQVLQASPDRVAAGCVHFGVCGGCQYQMATHQAQVATKEAILHGLLEGAGLRDLPPLQTLYSPKAYGYRNRVRLRLQLGEDELRLGYSVRGTNGFLPVTMCPIAAPLLWRAAEALQALWREGHGLRRLLESTAGAWREVEFFCDAEETALQVTFLCAGKRPPDPKLLEAVMGAFRALRPELTGAGLVRVDSQSGRPLESLGSWGAAGLTYRVGEDPYWVSRGSFFQVNRFLVEELVALVCGGRSGGLTWDLFAGVGLFSRRLARQFGAVTAVEAHGDSAAQLGRLLGKLGTTHRAVESTTVAFLRRAVLERDRPELIVLDPPRAGAGEEVCTLLAHLGPAELVYLSCDPTTLARDLAVLTRLGYRIYELHLIDLFPQTYHLETLVVLRRIVGN